MSVPGVYTLSAWTALASDTINYNDSIIGFNIDHYLAAPAPPFMYDVDSETACGTGCGSPCTLTGGWMNSTDDDIDWAADAAGTGSTGTGPLGDNTTGSGNYLYTEASGCYGMEAILLGSCIDLNAYSNPFLTFAYHMHGTSMGDLYVEIDPGTGIWATLFSAVGQQHAIQSDPWTIQEIDLNAYSGNVTIRFRGITGTNFYSDMALDDINIINKAANDANLTAILTPNSGCALASGEPVTIALINAGTATQDTIPVSYTVNGGTVITDTIYANLLAGDTIIYPFTTLADLSGAGTYTINAWVSLPGDTNTTNDSMMTIVYNGLDAIAVSLFSGFFAAEVSWDITNGSGTVIGSGSGYTTNNTVYDDTLCINACESFNFNMYDSFGDGWNGGYYSVTYVSTGDTIGGGGLLAGSFEANEFKYCDLPDAGTSALLAPNSNCALSDSEIVVIQLINYSLADTIDTITISYSINGGSPVTETVITTIYPGDTFTYTFNQSADLTADGSYTIDVVSMVTNDADTTNDGMVFTVEINVSPVPTTLPYTFPRMLLAT